MSNDFYDDFGPIEYEPGLYDRWRPALFAIAVLLTVVAIAVMRNSSSNESTNGSNPDVVVDSSAVPRETVPLTRTLRKGMKGDDVLRLQERLAELKFDPGPRDGEFGQNTLQAVWAFEKLVLDTPRANAKGEVTPSIWSIMESDLQITPRRTPDSPRHAEIDLVKQVMVVYQGGTPTLITHISTGSNEQWCEEVTIDPGEEGNNTREQIKKGLCGDAITPPGIFYFYNRKQGMRESRLGSMYNPVYFNYGIAVHGAILVPLEPASHGCVRIPMSVARYFPALVEYGDRVYVFDGIKEPEEYGSPPPPWDRPDPNYTTTTSLASTTTLKGAPTTTVAPTTLP
jgi:peptidoglycan hydrolase-like protein with peptidoglycan-binding domain